MSIINATLRDKAGKGSSRALRTEGKVPAIIYGRKKQNVQIAIDEKELMQELRKIALRTTVYEIQADKVKESVLVRDIQFDPVTDRPIHVDFLRVVKTEPVKVKVPLKYINHEKCQGLKLGGTLNTINRDLTINCKIADLVDYIEVDLANYKGAASIALNDLKLPKSSSHNYRDGYVIASINVKGGAKAVEEEEE